MSSAIELVLYRVLVTKYWKVASFTILIYDYLLTLEPEIELIWKSPWGIGKILFLITRYSALTDGPVTLWMYLAAKISIDTCSQINDFAMSLAVLGLASAEAILFTRTCALYNNAMKISFVLLSVWTFMFAAAIVVILLYLRSVKFGPLPSQFFVGCYQISGSRIIYVAFIGLLIQETLVIILTMYRATQTGIRTKDRLAHTLYRDGLLFYFCLIFITIGNIVVMTTAPPELVPLMSMFQRDMHAILSTRVLLNARGVARPTELTVADLHSVFTSFVPGTMSFDDADYALQPA